jgi:hypothetical protein
MTLGGHSFATALRRSIRHGSSSLRFAVSSRVIAPHSCWSSLSTSASALTPPFAVRHFSVQASSQAPGTKPKLAFSPRRTKRCRRPQSKNAARGDTQTPNPRTIRNSSPYNLQTQYPPPLYGDSFRDVRGLHRESRFFGLRIMARGHTTSSRKALGHLARMRFISAPDAPAAPHKKGDQISGPPLGSF